MFRGLCFWFLSSSVVAAPGTSPLFRFIGRHRPSEFNNTNFDWVGSGVSIKVTPSAAGNGGGTSNVVVDVDTVKGTRFSVYRQDSGKQVQVSDFFSGDGRAKITLAQVSDGDECTITLIKTSEDLTSTMSSQRVIKFYGAELVGSAKLQLTKPAVASRRLDVYGDSDSAAYGVDANAGSHQCNKNQTDQENFAHGWVTHVAEQLSADLHVQAVSGVGVFKNALDGSACSTKITLPNLIKRTLQSVSKDDYNATSASGGMPAAVLMYVGSNDYANLLPPSEKEFSEAYDGMVRSILKPWMEIPSYTSNPVPGALPAFVHICGGEAKPCNYIKAVVVAHNQEGKWRSTYTETGDKGATKGGCAGHRNATQQAALASRLAPFIAKAAGWN